MAECFVIRAMGGPDHGIHFTDTPGFEYDWPLPDTLPAPGGRYVKTCQSALPPQAEDSHVMRGAVYEWKPDEPGPESCPEPVPGMGGSLAFRPADEIRIIQPDPFVTERLHLDPGEQERTDG